jgi:GT2 family glycosyltransferase
MTNSLRVAAVIVTFNRKQYVLSCLNAVLAQTYPVAKIFLIDNASTDGTAALLASAGYLQHALVAYVRLPENIGGAGGFHEGLRLAVEDGFDWYWVLDDDVEPALDALQAQLAHRDISGCIHPLVLYDDGSAHEWEHILDPYTTHQIGLHNLSFRNGKSWCPMHVACFEGMLVSADVLTHAGLPEPDFFLSGDDGMFGFRASLYTNVIYVRSAVFVKKIKPTAQLTPLKLYYDLRNRFLLRRKLSRIIVFPPYSRYIFLCFMFFVTFDTLKRSFSIATVRAAALAWLDGARGVIGRYRY